MALPKTTKLTLQHVYDNFDKYNFIIFTKMGSIDTSVYNACKLSTGTILEESAKKTLELWRVTPDSDALQNTGDITVPANNQTYEIERYVKIHENVSHTSGTKRVKMTSEITRIQVKSVRGEKGYLLNQLKPKKL